MEKELQDTCRKLLEEKKVDLIIGYTKGSLPLRSTPCFIREKKDAENLVFDITCSINLAVYLTKKEWRKNSKKIGIIAKGCDGRSIVQHIVEGQIKREDVVIIGVPCKGVVEIRKLEEKIGKKEILTLKQVQGQIEDEKVIIEGNGFKTALGKQDVLSDSCLVCKYPNPPVYDIFVGEPRVGVSAQKEFELVEKFEKMSSDERWEYFEREISKCIRCYACRNACPLCYCEECFVDQTNPQWFGKSTALSDTMIFHIVRILHTASRCVGCGACARACPVGTDLAPLGIRLEKEIRERFNYTAGLDIEATPPMAAYKEDDKQEFIM